MAYGISGCVVQGSDGNKIRVIYKCDSCGWSNQTQGGSVPSTLNGVATIGSFLCHDCGRKNIVKVGGDYTPDIPSFTSSSSKPDVYAEVKKLDSSSLGIKGALALMIAGASIYWIAVGGNLGVSSSSDQPLSQPQQFAVDSAIDTSGAPVIESFDAAEGSLSFSDGQGIEPGNGTAGNELLEASSERPSLPPLLSDRPAVQEAIQTALRSGETQRWNDDGEAGYVVVSSPRVRGNRSCRNVQVTRDTGAEKAADPAFESCLEE